MKKITPPDEVVRTLFEERMPFHRHLGVTLESFSEDNSVVQLVMHDKFIGNITREMLHGGVISALHDLTGGLVVFALLDNAGEHTSSHARQECFGRISTIDLRVDYLRPGKGKFFRCSARVLRAGKRICVAHMELENEKQVLISVATAAYSIS